MSHRHHLTSLRLGDAFRSTCLESVYSRRHASSDMVAGLTVGVIAIPLSMALAIGSGVAPQHGLYTAMIAGLVIALAGGSRFSVSGPTAAFIVILLPVAQQFGLGGLLVATLMSGVMLIGMALARLGRLIEYIPEAVTLGFTAGIAIVIATLQLNDVLGLGLTSLSGHYWEKAGTLLAALSDAYWPSMVVGAATLVAFVGIQYSRLRFPPHLPALVIGTLVALALDASGVALDTIGSRFSFTWPDGSLGHGIPPFWPEFVWPWEMPDAHGDSPIWDWATVQALLPAAFSIAMLGAIESLLCAVVVDGMTNTRHSANSELLGQGLGNLLVPFFGGITATSALARSAANVKAGAHSPVAAMVHALVVMAGLLVLAPWLSYVPMAALAALLLLVAWNISEAPKLVHFVKTSPPADIVVLITCLLLTVLFDMVIAISVGVVLAALLFMQNVAAMTRITDISQHNKLITDPLPDGWVVYKISGPLFFAAADRVFLELVIKSDQYTGLVLYMDGVTLLDAGGVSAFDRFVAEMNRSGKALVIADLQIQPAKTLARAGLLKESDGCHFAPTLEDALQALVITDSFSTHEAAQDKRNAAG